MVDIAGGELEALPVSVAIGNRGIFTAEAFAGQSLFNRIGHFFLGGPDVLEVDGLAFLVSAQRVGVKVVADFSSQRVGHNKRRTHQVVGAHVHVDAALKIAVAAEHTYCHQAMLVDAFGYVGG